MSTYVEGLTHGLMIATVVFLLGLIAKEHLPLDTTEDQRAYEAYRVCIQRSDCRMTSQDWIDYYNLEWRLEK